MFVDESGAQLAMQKLYGRARRGVRVQAAKPEKNVRNLTLFAALGLSGVVGAMYSEWPADQMAFAAFLEAVLIPRLSPGQIVVMDNAPFHKCKAITDIFENAGVRYVYLPPYSPDFSPIEEMWSKVKATLRKLVARTMSAFHDTFGEALATLTEDDIQGWFEHCGYCVNQYE